MILSYSNVKSVVVCGDIHGDFETLVYKITIQYQLENTLVIVAGDCGFGFEKSEYYEQIFNRIQKRLSSRNNWIVMIRGNHDNPLYFSRIFRKVKGFSPSEYRKNIIPTSLKEKYSHG